MNGRIDAERILDAFLAPEADRLPDRVIEAALADIDRTPQRHAPRVPWRFPHMPALSRATAVATMAVVAAVGAGGILYLNSANSGFGGRVTPVPTASASPTATASAAATPRTTAYVPPALSQSFTSDIHGISLSFPAGWSVKEATMPWTTSDTPVFAGPEGDILYDPERADHLFIGVASQPLGDMPFEQWSTELLGDATRDGPIVVDGADGIRAGEAAVVSAGGRGYYIWLHASRDEGQAVIFERGPWFEEILAAVQLSPGDAVDTPAAP